jgi:hypothetical protein
MFSLKIQWDYRKWFWKGKLVQLLVHTLGPSSQATPMYMIGAIAIIM